MPARKREVPVMSEDAKMKVTKAAEQLWGPDVGFDQVQPGVFDVETSCHGGFLVDKHTAQTFLTPVARRHGNPVGSFLAYEEDCDAMIVLFEHPELLSRRVTKKVMNELLTSLEDWNPTYLAERKIKGPSELKAETASP